VRFNLTPRAQQALRLARKEAERLNHSFVGAEHLLIGLVALGDQGVAVNVLRKLGLDLDTVRLEVENLVGRGMGLEVITAPPYTPRVKKILALAAREARGLGHTYVGTEHVLLGLLAEEGGAAAKIFKALNIDAAKTREEILKELRPSA